MDLTKLIGVNNSEERPLSEEDVDSIFDKIEMYAEKITQLDSIEHRDLGFISINFYLEKLGLRYFFIDVIDRIELSVISDEGRTLPYTSLGSRLYDIISTTKLFATERELSIALYRDLLPLGAFTEEESKAIGRFVTPKEMNKKWI